MMMEDRKAVAIYLRVSSTIGQTVENQRIQLESMCKKREWDIVKVYADEGVSRDKRKPQLEKLVKDAKLGEFSAVAVFQLSRLGSVLREVLDNINTLNSMGIQLISKTENINCSNSDDDIYSQLLISLIICMSKIELQLLRERSKAGIERYIQGGGVMGRPSKTIDFKKCQQLMEVQGLSQNQTAKVLGVSPALLSIRLKEYRSLSPQTKQMLVGV